MVDPVPNILYLWRNVIFGQLVAKAPPWFNLPSQHWGIWFERKKKQPTVM